MLEVQQILEFIFGPVNKALVTFLFGIVGGGFVAKYLTKTEMDRLQQKLSDTQTKLYESETKYLHAESENERYKKNNGTIRCKLCGSSVRVIRRWQQDNGAFPPTNMNDLQCTGESCQQLYPLSEEEITSLTIKMNLSNR